MYVSFGKVNKQERLELSGFDCHTEGLPGLHWLSSIIG